MKGLLIFDLDGTIADTSAGIYSAYRHVAEELGIPEPSDALLASVIGGSLSSNLQMVYSLEKDQVKEAMKIYRDYYSEKGCLQSHLYEGFEQTARELKKRDYTLSIATMKAEKFAKRLIHLWGLDDTFSYISGADDDDTVTKANMIRKCMVNSKANCNNTYMIGDSPQDLKSAKECCVHFIAVSYGFQYNEAKCIESGLHYVNDIKSLLSLFR